MISCGKASNGNDAITTDLITNPESASGEVSKDALPKFKFDTETYDFGTITQGEKVSFSFKFKNTGGSSMIITSAKGHCGCTVPRWPKEPIKPGDTDEIEVTFNSENKSGNISKSITILANTLPKSTILTIKGNVKAPENN